MKLETQSDIVWTDLIIHSSAWCICFFVNGSLLSVHHSQFLFILFFFFGWFTNTFITIHSRIHLQRITTRYLKKKKQESSDRMVCINTKNRRKKRRKINLHVSCRDVRPHRLDKLLLSQSKSSMLHSKIQTLDANQWLFVLLSSYPFYVLIYNSFFGHKSRTFLHSIWMAHKGRLVSKFINNNKKSVEWKRIKLFTLLSLKIYSLFLFRTKKKKKTKENIWTERKIKIYSVFKI